MAASTLHLRGSAQKASAASDALRSAAHVSNSAGIPATKVRAPCRPALTKKGGVAVQANVKRKTEAKSQAGRSDTKAIEALRTPWAAVAAATALATLGAPTFADMRPHLDQSVLALEAGTSKNEAHQFSAASLSAPLLTSESIRLDADGALLLGLGASPEILLFNQPAEPSQPTFNPDDFRAKLPDGAGPLGGGDWSFSSMKTSHRSCPAWGINQNIEMVVPGAARPLQTKPPRGHKLWFASFAEADESQLQGGQEDFAPEQGGWEEVEVANPGEESAPQDEGSAVPVRGQKSPFEGLIIEIVRMPVFSCFSL